MAFDPPLGSTSPAVLLDNATRLDNLLNSLALVFPDRSGADLDTWRGIMSRISTTLDDIRRNLVPLSRQYMTLPEAQADIANIPVGSTTYYRSPDDSALAIEVMNVGGTLTATGRKMPSQQAVDEASDSANLALERVPEETVMPALVPVVRDMEGKVPVWLKDGDFDTRGVTDEFSDKVAGKGTAIPAALAMLPSEVVSPQQVPLFRDAAGNVPVYLVDGKLAAYGVDSSLINLIYAGLQGLFQPNMKFTDGRSAWRWRVAKSKYKLLVGAKTESRFYGGFMDGETRYPADDGEHPLL